MRKVGLWHHNINNNKNDKKKLPQYLVRIVLVNPSNKYIPISQMSKLRHKKGRFLPKVTQLACGRAELEQRQLDSKAHVFIAFPPPSFLGSNFSSMHIFKHTQKWRKQLY